MFTKKLITVASLLLMAGLAKAVAAPSNDEAAVGRAAPQATATVNSTNKIVALILPGGGIVRAKGVASVSHPSIGQYCIVPKNTMVVAGNLVPSVSVDWSNSSGNELLAFYRSSGSGCPANNISILTYTSPGGTAALSDLVGFTVIAQ